MEFHRNHQINYDFKYIFLYSLRGRLGYIYSYSRNFGVLFAYILGSYFNYIEASMVYTGITILFIVSFLLVPSTPQYLLQKNKNEVRLLISFVFICLNKTYSLCRHVLPNFKFHTHRKVRGWVNCLFYQNLARWNNIE